MLLQLKNKKHRVLKIYTRAAHFCILFSITTLSSRYFDIPVVIGSRDFEYYVIYNCESIYINGLGNFFVRRCMHFVLPLNDSKHGIISP